MDGIRIAAMAAVGAWLACGSSQAAEPQGSVYFINAAAKPLTVVIDGTSLAVPAHAGVTRTVSVGPHGVAAVIDGRTASQYSSLDADALAADRKGRGYWCFLAGEIKGAPRLTQMDVAQCRALVDAGADDAQPAPPVGAASPAR